VYELDKYPLFQNFPRIAAAGARVRDVTVALAELGPVAGTPEPGPVAGVGGNEADPDTPW
jgi:hypothetical protein